MRTNSYTQLEYLLCRCTCNIVKFVRNKKCLKDTPGIKNDYSRLFSIVNLLSCSKRLGADKKRNINIFSKFHFRTGTISLQQVSVELVTLLIFVMKGKWLRIPADPVAYVNTTTV